MVEFVVAGDGYSDERPGPSSRISQAEPDVVLDRAEAPLVPIMARLGPADLETVDTLITAGIASSRAEAVRWALARIRERPAYTKLRGHAREIEALKAEFSSPEPAQPGWRMAASRDISTVRRAAMAAGSGGRRASSAGSTSVSWAWNPAGCCRAGPAPGPLAGRRRTGW